MFDQHKSQSLNEMHAELIKAIPKIRERLTQLRKLDETVGLVPTMGALHRGHTKLIERARDECKTVVVSIFVNPMQFNQEMDFQDYPRVLDSDLEACTKFGVDLVFAPKEIEMYPSPQLCTIDIAKLTSHLCGAYRPGHFRGVATVALKLFQIIQPDRAYFGEKDAQQTVVIRNLVNDFNVPIEIIEVPTVREHDGLAISSRNLLLDSTERRLAIFLYQALCKAQQMIAVGDTSAFTVRQAAALCVPDDVRLRLEYLEIVDPVDMQPVEKISGVVRVVGALWVGSTRLIDNLLCIPGD